MTRYFLVLAAALLPLAGMAQTKAKPAAASTTQLESQLSAEICQDFEKLNAAKPFAQLSQPDAMSTFQQSMTQAAMKHPVEIEQLMTANGANASVAMREMGQRVAAILTKDCPLAVTLLSRIAGTEINAQTLDLTANSTEQPLLDKIARSVCADLSAQEVKQPLSQMPKAERIAFFQGSMQKHIMANAEELTKLYGPEFFKDAERIKGMGAKIGALTSTHCPTQVLTLMQP